MFTITLIFIILFTLFTNFVESQIINNAIFTVGLIIKLLIHGYFMLCVISVLDEINIHNYDSNLRLINNTQFYCQCQLSDIQHIETLKQRDLAISNIQDNQKTTTQS